MLINNYRKECMNKFEKKYYDFSIWWNNGTLEDDANRIRIKETALLIPYEVRSLLDVGCGNGIFCNYLKENFDKLEVTGLDRSETALSFVKTNKILGDITSLPFPDGSFDCVSCLEVIEHLSVEDYFKSLQEIARVAKKYILISVPYKEKIEKNTTRCPECMTVFNVDLHFRNFDDEKIKQLFTNYAFESIFTKNIIKGVRYIGLDTILHLIRKSNNKYRRNNQFRSPICPLCGYENPNFSSFSTSINKSESHHKQIIRVIKKLVKNIKVFFPKKQREGYWVIALYRKL